MKAIAVVSSPEVPSSAHAVVSNDDLLTEILLRLPVSSLVIFKSVSKRWLNLITNPNFTLRRSQNPIRRSPFVTFDSQKTEILQSCNGLLLCRNTSRNLHVYNPSTNRFKTVPEPQRYHNARRRFRKVGGFRMAFDPSDSPHYKILYAGMPLYHHEVEIQIYSSETSNWSVCRNRFPFLCFINGDVEHPVLTSIQTPRESPGDYQKLFESGGCLLLLCTGRFDLRHLSIYEMSKGCCSWSVKYVVDLDEIRVRYPQTRRWKRPEWFCAGVRCIMIGEKEEDSFLVMERYGKMIKYKMVSKTICKICELDSLDSSASFEFIASFAGV
ncbi:hypothetical protein SSX86_027973 [Deinandra increscens subsp. villosa]|uniref:F-box domain-containing protein n=1 Tax=Deinandra increscens subsp. villosa TaxID=3103831 RepID=A0AAP0GJ77_9ASTR